MACTAGGERVGGGGGWGRVVISDGMYIRVLISCRRELKLLWGRYYFRAHTNLRAFTVIVPELMTSH